MFTRRCSYLRCRAFSALRLTASDDRSRLIYGTASSVLSAGLTQFLCFPPIPTSTACSTRVDRSLVMHHHALDGKTAYHSPLGSYASHGERRRARQWRYFLLSITVWQEYRIIRPRFFPHFHVYEYTRFDLSERPPPMMAVVTENTC